MLPRNIKVAIVAAFVALFSFQAVRTAVVGNPATLGNLGARLWPSHPGVVLNRAMADIGALARRGQPPSLEVLRHVEETARKAPLAPEPYLVKGAIARVRGRDDVAERLFAQALARDPRSEAVRYLLADLYLHTGRPSRALNEMGIFARLMPSASGQIAPSIAAFAKTPGAIPLVRQFFRKFPELEPYVLLELANQASNADLIMALATHADDPHDAVPVWLETLVRRLVGEGEFAKAYDAWKNGAGIRRTERGLFNPTFERSPAPPPFNWKYTSKGGVAEPDGRGRLRVAYYGSESSVLAEQLLMLPRGRYQLSMDLTGDLGAGNDVKWTLTCLPGSRRILALPLDGTGKVTGTFLVDADCTAERLELIGSASEFPKTTEFSIGSLKLTPVASQ